jgi:hypothetical protein
LVVDRNGWETIPGRNAEAKEPFFKGKQQAHYRDGMNEHIQNFLKCVREGGDLNCPVEVGAKTAIVSEMGNIAYRTGKRIHWNNTTKSFEEEDASQLMKLQYNENWKLPKV